MLDAIVGSVIVVAATAALALAVEVGEQAYRSSGRYPLNQAEKEMLQSAGLADADRLRLLQADLNALPQVPVR